MPVITGAQLAQTFRQYEYVGYLWGGHSPDTGWDCSGACNWLIGFKYQLAIPGRAPGQYGPGSDHGPVVADWITWVGVLSHVWGSVQEEPGDLVAWGPNVHMGMVISPGRFVSAANPSAGTIEADIAGFFPYNPVLLRVLELLIRPVLPSIPPPPGPGNEDYSPTMQRTANTLSSAGQRAYYTAGAIRDLRR